MAKPTRWTWLAAPLPSLLIIFGTGVMGYGISSLTLLLFQGDLPHYLRVRKMDKIISRLENHIIICGLSRTGLYALEELTRSGHDVVIIEKSEAQIQQWLGGRERPYIVGDATEDDNLLAAGIERAQAIITSLTSDADNAFVVVTARSLNSQLSIVSKSRNRKRPQKVAGGRRGPGSDSVLSGRHEHGQPWSSSRKPCIFSSVCTRATPIPSARR